MGFTQAQDQWEKLTLPERLYAFDSMQATGQASSSIASRIAVDEKGRLYLSNVVPGDSPRHSLMESDDRGNTWNAVSAPEIAYSISDKPLPIALGPDGLVLWGLNRLSRDAGVTWTALEDPPHTSMGTTSTFIAKEGWLTATLTNDVIRRSGDSGKSWEKLTPLANYYSIRQFQTGGTEMIFGAGQNLLISTSDGATWRRWNEPNIHTTTSPYQNFKISLQNQGTAWTLWALCKKIDASVQNYLLAFRSGKAVDSVPINLPASLSTAWLTTEDGIFWVGTTEKGVFFSRDQGKSWSPSNEGLGSMWVESLLQTPSGEMFLIAQDGLYRSKPSGTGLVRQPHRNTGGRHGPPGFQPRRNATWLFPGPGDSIGYFVLNGRMLPLFR